MTVISEEAQRAINNARALLDAMLAGGWQQVCITGNEGDYFIARDRGIANPLLVAGETPAAPVPQGPAKAIMAPHVGTVAWLVPVGHAVAAGDVIVRLMVLDEQVDVVAASAGKIAEHHVRIDELAQFGTPLLALAA
jgi:biotin carboxyl carrier protein